MEELDHVAGGIIEQYLAAAASGDDVAAKAGADRTQHGNLVLEVVDLELDAVPAPWFRPATLGRGLARPAGTGLVEQQA